VVLRNITKISYDYHSTVDFGTAILYNIDINSIEVSMKSVQLLPNVRYVPLSDDEGDFGMFLVHDDNEVYHAHEVHDREEFTKVFQDLSRLYSKVG